MQFVLNSKKFHLHQSKFSCHDSRQKAPLDFAFNFNKDQSNEQPSAYIGRKTISKSSVLHSLRISKKTECV